MIYIKILLIAFIVVYICDLTGLSESIEKYLRRWFKRPVEFKLCSLCFTHHIGLLFLLCVGEFTLFTYAFVCLCSFMSTSISNLCYGLKELFDKIINKIF